MVTIRMLTKTVAKEVQLAKKWLKRIAKEVQLAKKWLKRRPRLEFVQNILPSARAHKHHISKECPFVGSWHFSGFFGSFDKKVVLNYRGDLILRPTCQVTLTLLSNKVLGFGDIVWY